ncbi:dynein light chain Tctex-type protein 2 [Microcaecilia unicolor]|uniref:Tctex1 domain-containing protein 3 n=1 Tax=Microcaecilia unicolor TaxID=1415580 RepID=A0A6P7X9J2_9AMPH|nr:tctex1 domain-containing protein 3 [Microcaecilia unicolor]
MGDEEDKVPRKKSRRPSMFEVDAFPQLMKERMRGVSHDVVCVEPGILEEGGDDDVAKAESVVWKASLPKFKFANTYRMEPKKKFLTNIVKTKIEQILKDGVQGTEYEPDLGRALALSVATDILAAVKKMEFDRYKYIVGVILIEKAGQGIHMSSRCLLDDKWDNWVSVVYETATCVALASVFAMYYE